MSFSLSRFVRGLRYGKPIVVVSGLPRSGTSMAMKMLQAGGVGVVTDGVREADQDNPGGYYEDERIKDLHRIEEKGFLRQARGRAVKVISFLLKDLPADNSYKVIFMERDLEEILASQEKMLAHRDEESATENERMRDVYVEHLRHVRFMVGYRRHFDTLFLDYREVLQRPEASARRINAFVGGGLDEQAMAEVVDPSLYRNRADASAVRPASGDE